MAIRIRQNGKMYCAALNEERPNDVYIDDELHYQLSVIKKILVTTDNNHHMANKGEWWWRNQVPENVKIDDFYND